MTNQPVPSKTILRSSFRLLAFDRALLCALALTLTQLVQAQTFSVLHTFGGGGSDGAAPYAGLTIDGNGNLYGTTYNGGPYGHGAIYKLTRGNGQWLYSQLYSWSNNGGLPLAGVVIGPDRSLYGTTSTANPGVDCRYQGCGTVFNLKPPATPTGAWTFRTLYNFQGYPDANSPQFGSLVFDASGAMYGTTLYGGAEVNLGAIYKLTPSGQDYIESVIYGFIDGHNGGHDGFYPYGSVVFDAAGNLYTTTSGGGTNDYGAIVELTPSGGNWIETVIYSLGASPKNVLSSFLGFYPKSGLIFDRTGNLYGTTYSGFPGVFGDGTVFELKASGGSWTATQLQGFPYIRNHSPGGPVGDLVMDAAGNLYGTTTANGAYGLGNVFELTRANGSWLYRDLYDFIGVSDGGYPYGTLTLDSNGNIYGTTSEGGSSCNCGTIWEIQMP